MYSYWIEALCKGKTALIRLKEWSWWLLLSCRHLKDLGLSCHPHFQLPAWMGIGTKNGRWQAYHRVVDFRSLTKIVMATSKKAFALHQSFGLTSSKSRYRTTNHMKAIDGVLSLPLCHSWKYTSQWLILPLWTHNTVRLAWIGMVE